MRKVHVSIVDKRMSVEFQYDQKLVNAIKSVPGARFIPKHKGGPRWTVPLNLDTAKDLRRAFGDSLVISPELRDWAWAELKQRDELGTLATADDAELEHLSDVLPDLAKTLFPYQRAAARFITTSPNPLIADQAGLGKTLEVIAGLFESGEEPVRNLIVAPKTSLRSVWKRELERWQPYPVFVCDGSFDEAQEQINLFKKAVKESPAWLVVNPAKVRYESVWNTDECDVHDGSEYAKDRKACPRCSQTELMRLNDLKKIKWSTIVIDECHKDAVRNPKTKGARALNSLKADKRIAMSGTPMTNKLVDLWGTLHYLEPKQYSSKWNWVFKWLHTYHDGYGYVICLGCDDCDHGLQLGVREDFFESIKPYVLRRTKAEVHKQLPPKRYINRWCSMTQGQAAQYHEFAELAEAIIDDERVSAQIKLTEILRLKQFAIAKQRVTRDGDEVKLSPTIDGGKIEELESLLAERDIFDVPVAESMEDEKVVIFSQFREVIDELERWLEGLDVPTLKVTGKVKGSRRDDAVHTFQQEDGPRVMLMTTQAGGVAITLDRADTVIFMDETWSPAEQEQAEDRVHRVSRDHNVFVYYLRTSGTVDEYVMDVVVDKSMAHSFILDIRRGKVKLR